MKKQIRTLSLAVVSVLVLTGTAELDYRNKQSYESKAIQAFMLYCVPPLQADLPTASTAEADRLPQLSHKAASAYLNGDPGKAFSIPDAGKGAVLVAWKAPQCAVIFHRVNPLEFMKQLDYWFDTSNTAFQMTQNTTSVSGEMARQYAGQIGGAQLALSMNVHIDPLPKGAQAVLTARNVRR